MSQALAAAHHRQAALAELPERAPALGDTGALQRAAAGLAALRAGVEQARGRLGTVNREIAAVEAEIARIVDGTGGRCPTCGGAVDDPLRLLDHHGAPAQEAAA